MLTHCQQFFKSFPVSATPAWQMARAWHTLRPLRLAGIRRALQVVHCLPQCLPPPAFHVTGTDPITPRAPVRPWWTPPAVSVGHLHGPYSTSRDRVRAQGSGVVWGDVHAYRREKYHLKDRSTAHCAARPWPRGAARPVLVVTLIPEVADASALRGRWDPDRRAAPLRVRVRGMPVVWRRPHGVQRCAVPAPRGGAGAVWQRRVLPAGAEVGAAPGGEAEAVSLAPTEALVMPTRTTRSDLQAQAAATRAARPVTLRQEGRHA